MKSPPTLPALMRRLPRAQTRSNARQVLIGRIFASSIFIKKPILSNRKAQACARDTKEGATAV